MDTQDINGKVSAIVRAMMDSGMPLMQADALGQAIKFAVSHPDFARQNGIVTVYRLQDFIEIASGNA